MEVFAAGDDVHLAVRNDGPWPLYLTGSILHWPELLTADGLPDPDAYVNWFRFNGVQYYDGDDESSPTNAAAPEIPLWGSSTAEWQADFGGYQSPLIPGAPLTVELTFAPGSCRVSGTLYPAGVVLLVPASEGIVINSRGETRFQADAGLLDGGASRGKDIRRVRFQILDPSGAILLDHSEYLSPYCAFGDALRSCKMMPPDLWRSFPPGTYQIRARAEALNGVWSPWAARSFLLAAGLGEKYAPTAALDRLGRSVPATLNRAPVRPALALLV
jgi:hypothetical protein